METDCVIWTGHIRPKDGYGIHWSGRMAHRVLWEKTNGLIPDGIELDHLCKTRACVNLEHLVMATRAENIATSEHWSSKKTTCPKGHPYDRVWGGKRYCSVCRSARERESRDKKRKTTCKNGHPFDGTNVRGGRTCSTCMSINGKAAMASRWGSQKATVMKSIS